MDNLWGASLGETGLSHSDQFGIGEDGGSLVRPDGLVQAWVLLVTGWNDGTYFSSNDHDNVFITNSNIFVVVDHLTPYPAPPPPPLA